MNRNKSVKTSLIAIACVLALGAQVSKANTTYSLDVGDSDLSPTYPGSYGSVTVSLTDSTHATITFTGGAAGGYTYLLGANNIANVNVNATTFSISVTSVDPGFSDGPSSQNVSMFGKFNGSMDNTAGFTFAVPSLTLSVTDTSGTWLSSADVLAADDKGYFVSAHIFVVNATGLNPQTGFAGSTTGTNTVPDGGSTVALLGLGLLGLRWVRQVTSKKK